MQITLDTDTQNTLNTETQNKLILYIPADTPLACDINQYKQQTF